MRLHGLHPSSRRHIKSLLRTGVHGARFGIVSKWWRAAEVLFSRRTSKDFSWLPWSICGLIVVFTGLLVLPVVAEPAPKVCVEDDLSRQVCVSAFPKRVISLAPSLTETVFDLGAGNMLVGRTARCNEPPEVLKIQDVGAYLNPDLERVIALRPDLVLCPETGMRKEVVDRLTELGISTFVDSSKTLNDIIRLLERLGVILGRESEAHTIVQQFQLRRQAVRERVDHAGKPLVLFVVGIRPLVLAGGRSFIGSLIREAGGVNVAEKGDVPYPKFSMEEVVRRDPDIIIVLNKECREDECFNEWRKHPDLRAVKNNKIYQLDADLIARPSARIMDALEQLAAILHPKGVR